MTIILDDYVLPEKGVVNIDVSISFEIKHTAVQAKRAVNEWLLNEISYLIGAEAPTLIVQKHPAWRVPIWLTLPGTNHKEIIGVVDVDVETGKMIDPVKSKSEIEQYLRQNEMATGDAFLHELPPDYIANLTPPPQIIK